MKLSRLLMTTSLCAAVTGPAFAQGMPFNEVDTDSNGKLSMSELVEVFGATSAERIIVRADRDGDGELTRLEIRIRNDDDEDDEEDDDEDDEEDDDESYDDEEDDEEDDDEDDDFDEDYLEFDDADAALGLVGYLSGLDVFGFE